MVLQYDTHEYLSPSFRAQYYGRCPSCSVVFDIDDEVQYIGNKLGHPVIGTTISFQGHQYVRSCQRDACPDLSYKETKVSVTDEIRRTEQQLDALYAKRAAIQKFGTDAEYPDGAVLLFRHTHTGTYWRAAVKTSANCWHVTGSGNPSFRFDDLVERHLVGASEVWFGTEYEKI